ncbi:nuclear transport factor 2 family protein [Roseovarius sp. A21]|uniref:Nuclear transport factor 2 family protein n=1 Tax=Roseovarius bejariae TaxID=2576383 RepID=A0A844D4L1_9RHOB|nr:nuclear transport factor 2 family protein [Roseovarius bejariae]MRU17094.1 nuclear transport factor 2 family protein [Roseovarius bejariae]
MIDKIPDHNALECAVLDYFNACNSRDESGIRNVFDKDVVNYLPGGMFGPVHGVEPLIELWKSEGEQINSHWHIETVFGDPERKTAVAEWTAMKPGRNKMYRGVDWFTFNDEGKITEVRGYYAAPRDDSLGSNELGGFPYAERGWTMPEFPITYE